MANQITASTSFDSEFASCDIDAKPCAGFILSECGKARKVGLTPNQVVDSMICTVYGDIDRSYLLAQVHRIQYNWFNAGLVVGLGDDFPFKASNH